MWAWAIIVKPFMAFLFLSVALLGRLAVERYLPEGKLKRLLLRRIK
jgi:hypothetical protein